MLPNSWFKKEKPFQGMMGAGGGVGGRLQGGGGAKGYEATGGVVSDYTHPDGTAYRCHIFTASGDFTVTTAGTTTLSYMIVAGGGGSGSYSGGGGGAGGMLLSPDFAPPTANQGGEMSLSATTYPIVIGQGGAESAATSHKPPSGAPKVDGQRGESSSFNSVSATGGGGGAGWNTPAGGREGVWAPGGSGGGGFGHEGSDSPGGEGTNVGSSNQQGYDGGVGTGGSRRGGGGGGGASSIGQDGNVPAPTGGAAGEGYQILMAGPPTFAGFGANLADWGDPAAYQWFGGGGGGAGHGASYNPSTRGTLGKGGGGYGAANPATNTRGQISTGGGGGGWTAGEYRSAANTRCGDGGPGAVMIRYQLMEGIGGTAKATGGCIHFIPADSPSPYAGKTVHTFLQPGTFTNPTNLVISYLIVGGGGGGGGNNGGGGGGGGVIGQNDQPLSAAPTGRAIEIGVGGVAARLKSSLSRDNVAFETRR